MSLLGLHKLIPLSRAHRAEPTATDAEGDGGVGYVLVYNPPDAPAPGHRRGWTLHARPARPRDWSTSLAGHGAGIHTGPRAAKAVAVRVLADRGVAVSGWADRPDVENRGIAMFSARTQPGAPTPSAGSTERGPTARSNLMPPTQQAAPDTCSSATDKNTPPNPRPASQETWTIDNG